LTEIGVRILLRLRNFKAALALEEEAEAVMAQRSGKHGSGKHDGGPNILLGTLLVMGAALTLVVLANLNGRFGHSRTISLESTPVWPASSFK
jgi:hypothetical protein